MSDSRKTRQWRAVRERILARDAYTCRIQGAGCTVVATTVDHIVPLHDGGPMWDLANLRAACVHCNMGRPNPNQRVNVPRRFRYRTTIASTHTRL